MTKTNRLDSRKKSEYILPLATKLPLIKKDDFDNKENIRPNSKLTRE
jgi:hypothetical protein